VGERFEQTKQALGRLAAAKYFEPLFDVLA
jgi:hypothetical protein